MERTINQESERFRQELFHRWTSGLLPLQKRINIFSRIRDIPYAIIPEWRNKDDIPRLMVQENKGWCGPKHILLSWMFERLGIRIILVSIPFRWQDQPIMYPESLVIKLKTLPDTNHLCCKAFIEGSWKFIDATWDSPLRKAGFPVNDPWDGLSETIPAVTRLEYERPEMLTKTAHPARSHQFNFTDELNRWLETIRQKEGGLK